MTCDQELISLNTTTLLLLCIQIFFVLFFWKKNIRMQDRTLSILLIIGHPYLWKKRLDCGEELLQTSILFLGASLGITLWSYYRIKFTQKETPDEQE